MIDVIDMGTSLWHSDIKAEKEIGNFLDERFYCSSIVKGFQRFTSKAEQLKGRDVRFSIGERKDIIVDEKVQSHYVNKNLPTFAFEIDFMSNNRIAEGWLFDTPKETQYYLLIWVWAEKERDFTKDDIVRLECLLVERRAILNFLQSQGLEKDRVSQISKEIRNNGIAGPSHKDKFDSCYFFYTPRLAEMPMNIVIRKSKLYELADVVVDVSRDGIKLNKDTSAETQPIK